MEYGLFDVAQTMTMVSKIRATQKAQTRQRIADAAWELFTSTGYDGTTTKAVAARAGVASGTVFVHASDKADLLAMVMHDRLASTVDEAFATLPRAELLPQLLHVFGALFRMYGENPKLASAFVQTLVPGATGPNGQRVHALTMTFLHRLAGVVGEAQLRGEVGQEVMPLLAASNLFGLYLYSLLLALTGVTTLEAALEPGLRMVLELQLRGLAPR
jgi:AcrR family transcriptional regulator